MSTPNHQQPGTTSSATLELATPLTSAPMNPGAGTIDRRQDIQSLGEQTKQATIMIVDDEPINIKVARKYLETAGYKKFIKISDSTQAIDVMTKEVPDVVLLDIMMPHVSGFDILEAMRASDKIRHIPVIVLTAVSDSEVKLKALDLGATDFLTKPVEPNELAPRIRNTLIVKAHQDHLANQAEQLEHAVKVRTAELAASRQEVIQCLARAADYRDDNTGHHVVRVGRYAGIVARALGFSPETVELIEQAAQLHDVGKIGIPDSILLKPYKLEPQEYEIMQKHCGFGKKIIQRLPEDDWATLRAHAELGTKILDVRSSPVMRLASTIALTHHEKWDGTGYPLGLEGEDIPIEGRITAVADVFDALSSKRPYKPPFPREKCFGIMQEGRGTQFDPMVLDAFFAHSEEIIKVQIEFADLECAQSPGRIFVP